MYNSSLKNHGENISFAKCLESEKAFLNDMSKTYYRDEFGKCDVIYSEIAWMYGYKGFNDKAGNAPNSYADYISNIVKLIKRMKVPAFIVCGKNVKSYFRDAKMSPISITTSGQEIEGCTLYAWNSEDCSNFNNTSDLVRWLQGKFKCCLDFSCGYGQHLMGFDDCIGCDINPDCITYLNVLLQEKERRNYGTTQKGN